jgi:hypothetical protein
MVKRNRAREAPTNAPGRRLRPDIVQSSVYLPEPVYEALRETAFKERLKIHDVLMEGIGLALRKAWLPIHRGFEGGQETISSGLREPPFPRPDGQLILQ